MRCQRCGVGTVVGWYRYCYSCELDQEEIGCPQWIPVLIAIVLTIAFLISMFLIGVESL